MFWLSHLLSGNGAFGNKFIKKGFDLKDLPTHLSVFILLDGNVLMTVQHYILIEIMKWDALSALGLFCSLGGIMRQKTTGVMFRLCNILVDLINNRLCLLHPTIEF